MTFFQDFPVPPAPPRGRAVRYVPPHGRAVRYVPPVWAGAPARTRRPQGRRGSVDASVRCGFA